MSGLDEILNMIDLQQKENEKSIMEAAEKRIAEINADAEEKADAAYEESIRRSAEKNRLDYENACSAADAAMKRKILTFKVENIEIAIENTIKRLHDLEAGEYFKLLERLILGHMSKGEGVVSLGERDLKRMPADFAEKVNAAAKAKGGSVVISGEAAGIDDGFILSYGNISENCSFRAIVEAEKEGVRDTAARVLFG